MLSETNGYVVARHPKLSTDFGARCAFRVHANHLRHLIGGETVLAKTQAASPKQSADGGSTASKLLGQVVGRRTFLVPLDQLRDLLRLQAGLMLARRRSGLNLGRGRRLGHERSNLARQATKLLSGVRKRTRQAHVVLRQHRLRPSFGAVFGVPIEGTSFPCTLPCGYVFGFLDKDDALAVRQSTDEQH